MARAKKTPPKAVKLPAQKKESRFPNFLLALTFLIVVLLLISLFFKNSNVRFTPQDIAKIFTRSNSQPSPSPAPAKQENTKAVAGEDYMVQEGDTLWKIAEEAYGSGFNYTDIVEANKLANPGALEPGQLITLPKAEAKQPTRGETVAQSTGEVTPTAAATQTANKSEYIVQRGDCLWNIAVETYGDGFQWTRIAQANNLANPTIIHAGNRLTLP